jgi:hypothetical protein
LGEQLVDHIKLLIELLLGFIDGKSCDFDPLEPGFSSLQILLDGADNGHSVGYSGGVVSALVRIIAGGK